MRVYFWGVRGSLASPPSPRAWQRWLGRLRAARARTGVLFERRPPPPPGLTGGHTPCVEVRHRRQRLVLDAGTGLVRLGRALMRGAFGRGRGTLDLLVSHTHWDHIQGFPFFEPAYRRGNRLTIHGPQRHLARAFRRQQHPDHFPVPLEALPARIRFRRSPVERWFRIGDLRVYALRVPHPGECYAFRIESDLCSLVYATDLEVRTASRGPGAALARLAQGAALLIFDAYHGTGRPRGWGHSSATLAAQVAARAGVRRLALFHHDPRADDRALTRAAERARRELRRLGASCEVLVAREDEACRLA